MQARALSVFDCRVIDHIGIEQIYLLSMVTQRLRETEWSQASGLFHPVNRGQLPLLAGRSSVDLHQIRPACAESCSRTVIRIAIEDIPDGVRDKTDEDHAVAAVRIEVAISRIPLSLGRVADACTLRMEAGILGRGEGRSEDKRSFIIRLMLNGSSVKSSILQFGSYSCTGE